MDEPNDEKRPSGDRVEGEPRDGASTHGSDVKSAKGDNGEPPRAAPIAPPPTHEASRLGIGVSPSRPPSARRDTGRPSSPDRPSKPADKSEEFPLHQTRDRFAVGLMLPLALSVLAANAIGGLLAPGWLGVGSELAANRWRWWGTVTPLAAALLGIGTSISLVMAAVANPRTSISTRLVSTFGAGLVLTLVAAAFRNVLEPTHLIVLFAGAFAVIVASAVEAISPPTTRAFGVQLSVFGVSALLRVGAWGVAWSASNRAHPDAMKWAQACAGGALILELVAQALAVAYLASRPGIRGKILAPLALGGALFLALWTVRTTFDPDTAGSLRDAMQRAMSLRVQGSGPLPWWVDRASALSEIALLDPGAPARASLLPLVFAEYASMTLAAAALLSARSTTIGLLAALAVALASRGQIDTPLRALELAVAALAGLVLSRGARVRYATTARGSERPPP